MLLVPVEGRETERRPAPERVLLRCDDTGCTLCQAVAQRRFPDVQAALDFARRSRETKAAIVEIWQHGQYICCVMPRSGPDGDQRFPGIAGPRLVSDSALDVAERFANRVARFLMGAAGPVFWLALAVALLAASLGWRLQLS